MGDFLRSEVATALPQWVRYLSRPVFQYPPLDVGNQFRPSALCVHTRAGSRGGADYLLRSAVIPRARRAWPTAEAIAERK